MLVLGIDPGSVAMGLSAVRRRAGRRELVYSRVVRTQSSTPIPQRLLALHRGLEEALFTVQPDEAAIESIFKHKSAESALRLGQARASRSATQAGLPLDEYNAMTVKKTVAGHGRAGSQVSASCSGCWVSRSRWRRTPLMPPQSPSPRSTPGCKRLAALESSR